MRYLSPPSGNTLPPARFSRIWKLGRDQQRAFISRAFACHTGVIPSSDKGGASVCLKTLQV